MAKQPVFESSLGSTFRITSTFYNTSNGTLYARGIIQYKGMRSNGHIEMKYLIGSARRPNVTWKYKETV